MFKKGKELTNKYKKQLSNNLDKIKDGLDKLVNEGKETKEIINIITLALKENRKLTIDEKTIVDAQIKDLGKLSLLIPLAILPGAPITIPILYSLADKLGIDIIPSSFKLDDKLLDSDDLNKSNIDLESNEINNLK